MSLFELFTEILFSSFTANTIRGYVYFFLFVGLVLILESPSSFHSFALFGLVVLLPVLPSPSGIFVYNFFTSVSVFQSFDVHSLFHLPCVSLYKSKLPQSPFSHSLTPVCRTCSCYHFLCPDLLNSIYFSSYTSTLSSLLFLLIFLRLFSCAHVSLSYVITGLMTVLTLRTNLFMTYTLGRIIYPNVHHRCGTRWT